MIAHFLKSMPAKYVERSEIEFIKNKRVKSVAVRQIFLLILLLVKL